MRLLAIFPVYLALMACSSSNAEADLNCADIIGMEALLSPSGPDIIVIGELHGMTAPPEFVSALTCHSLAKGLKTNLALEIYDEDNRLAGFIESDGSYEAETEMLRAPMWTTGFTDGRSSEAVLSLIKTARQWKSEAQPLFVTAFRDVNLASQTFETPSEGSAAFEKGMAENIIVASQDHDKTIVLVGNLHASMGRWTYGDLDYTLMAAHLPRARTLTFDMVATEGTGWNCIGQPIICGVNPYQNTIRSDHPVAVENVFRVLMKDELKTYPKTDVRFNAEDYDGLIFMGQAVASPPANADGRAPL
ncbi:hypothetical protein [Litorimonas sp. WD9-15]|uniref:hypothetical protein n=1 Tax=Litorimonas sp. WD9-15 TaxID=3418716 RepID=UPI003D079E28